MINSHQSATSGLLRDPDLKFPAHSMERAIVNATGEGKTHLLNATRLATGLMGDAIAGNLFMLGYAYQCGLVPISGDAIERAIELNGVAIEANKQAFVWGRRTAHDPTAVECLLQPDAPVQKRLDRLGDIVKHRMEHLTEYQNAALARRYQTLVARVHAAEEALLSGHTELSKAVARNYARLLSYKDEYEVARLFTDGRFRQSLENRFEGDYTLEFHLAPPVFARTDPNTGHLIKQRYGPWMMRAFHVLAKLRVLRNTPLDFFGYAAERQAERALIEQYESTVDQLLAELSPRNHDIAVEIAALPQSVRGYGHVKEANLVNARERLAELMAAFHNPPSLARAA